MKTSEPMQRFINHLGKKPYCSSDLDCGLKIRTKKHALRHDYISVNKKLRRYLIMDIDREKGALAYEDIGIEPTIIITNPENTHAHLLFELENPILFAENARPKIQEYFKAVQRGMVIALRADVGYTHFVTKNPLSDRWWMTCCDVRYSLGDITEYCKPINSYSYEMNIDIDDSEGRNCSLFNKVRRWAYFQVKEFVVFEAWHQSVLDKCIRENTFMPCLPYSEVKATAKSIANWTWENRHKIGHAKNRGAAQVDKRLKTSNRQKAGAEYTNQLRKEKTEQKIIKAIKQLKEHGCKITASCLEQASGVSRRTLYNHKHLWI